MPAWPAPFDPSDKKDYQADFSAVLTPISDEISGATVTLDSAAVAAGVEVCASPPVSYTTSGVTVWFEVPDPADRSASVFNSPGLTVTAAVQITTAGGRRFEQGFTFAVVQR